MVDIRTLKEILIKNLKLEDMTPEDIDDTMPLFGEEGRAGFGGFH